MSRWFLVVLCALCAESRLATDVIPELYQLKLDLSSGLDNPSNSYTGSVSISLNVRANVKSFTLHALGLKILNTSLIYEVLLGDIVLRTPIGHNRSLEEESLVISSMNIPPGRIILDIPFEGQFGSNLDGFYKSSYQTQQTHRWMASTHFESQGARKAFPCFDEPSLRAKFILELILPPELHGVSNMPVSSTSALENGWKRVLFAESPSMPTYLMAWYVGDATFDALHSTTVNDITYSVHGRADLKEQAEYAFNITPDVIAGLESFTGILYNSSNMTTMGQAAIPDFSAGAMENWGLVTYREAYLMYDQNASSVLNKQHILSVIAHELAHQWFGNAVTLDWWSYAWLNEGFARYLQYVIPNKMEPSWKLNDQFLTDVFQLSMSSDLGSHPLTNPNVTTKDEIEDMFDVITYGKGASLLRMFSSVLGEEAFRGWLNAYLNRVIQSGRVAKPGDLFAALPVPSLAEKFKPWTEVSGHPVVNVTSVRNNDSIMLRLSQVKENLTGSHLPTGLHVPVNVFQMSNLTTSFVPLSNDSLSNSYNYTMQPLTGQAYYWLGNKTLDMPLSTEPLWYLVNMDTTGYYRVLYDEDNWKSLRNAIGRASLTPLVRAQLVSDALNLVKTGYLQPAIGFDFVRFLKNEKDLLVWKAALMAFKDIRDHLLGWADARDELDDFVRTLMDNALTINFSQSEDRHYENVLRMYLAQQACVYRSNLCPALQLLSLDNHTLIESIDRDTDGVLLCEMSKIDGMYWERLWTMYLDSNVPTQKARYFTSLSCTVNPTLQSKLLGYTLNPDVIKLQDISSVFTRICDAKNGTASAMNFIRDHGSQFVNRMSSKRNVRKILEAISNRLYTNGMVIEMEDVLSKTPALGLTNQEKSDLISKAKKAASNRQLVAKRVCEGFQMVCLPPQDPVPDDGGNDNAATTLVQSFGVFLVAIAISVSPPLLQL